MAGGDADSEEAKLRNWHQSYALMLAKEEDIAGENKLVCNWLFGKKEKILVW